MLLRYVIIALLLYLLYRLFRATIRDFLANLSSHRAAHHNIYETRKRNLDHIQDATYEEIKDDPEEKKS